MDDYELPILLCFIVFVLFPVGFILSKRRAGYDFPPFLFSYFYVILGCGQRYYFSVSGDNLAERIANLEWATNIQTYLCFTAVVSALHVLYNQRAKATSAE